MRCAAYMCGGEKAGRRGSNRAARRSLVQPLGMENSGRWQSANERAYPIRPSPAHQRCPMAMKLEPDGRTGPAEGVFLVRGRCLLHGTRSGAGSPRMNLRPRRATTRCWRPRYRQSLARAQRRRACRRSAGRSSAATQALTAAFAIWPEPENLAASRRHQRPAVADGGLAGRFSAVAEGALAVAML